MSRIFDSLKKASGRHAALPLFGEPQKPVHPSSAPANLDAGEPADKSVNSPNEPNFATASPGPSEADQKAPPRIRMVKALPVEGAPVLPFDGTHAASAEQYRMIRTKIVQHPLQPRLLAVSSPSAGDGKTISALNIAGALSLKGEVKVLLVETDVRRSSFCKLLQLPDEPGLIDVLARKCTLEEAVMEVEQLPNLFLLGSGEFRPDASELLDSPFGRAVFQAIRKRFQFVVLDCPPIGSVADYEVVQAIADGVVIVLRPDHTSRSSALQVLTSVPQDKLVGVVMNHVKPWLLWRTATSPYYYVENSPRT